LVYGVGTGSRQRSEESTQFGAAACGFGRIGKGIKASLAGVARRSAGARQADRADNPTPKQAERNPANPFSAVAVSGGEVVGYHVCCCGCAWRRQGIEESQLARKGALPAVDGCKGGPQIAPGFAITK
jgi:hypothetical protein